MTGRMTLNNKFDTAPAMTITFYSNYLNHHQIGVADELYSLLGNDYHFVVTMPILESELKGGDDYTSRPYCIDASNGDEMPHKALLLARESDVCIFGACSQTFAVERAKNGNGGISFEVGERWLKRGWINILSPTLRDWYMNYRRYFSHASFFKLCCSGFTASDDRKLGAYRGKHYKWGYFTAVPKITKEKYFEAPESASKIKILWIGRFLSWKHPELPLAMAKTLKDKGYDFTLDYYGAGPEEYKTKSKAEYRGLTDVIRFHGSIPNDNVHEVMLDSDIVLFTSDRNEGWGAVANEAMANACVLVTSDAIGSTPYLIKDGINGLVFKSMNAQSLTDKIEWLLNNPSEIGRLKRNAYKSMRELWNPANAAKSLLRLIEDLQNGRESSITEGPCSKA